MHPLLQKLDGGDRRSIGRSEEVVADVLADPALFDVVFHGMLVDDNPLIRMRAADAVEKITAQHPAYLQPYKPQLLDESAAIEQQEVRGHAAQMSPRLELTEADRAQAVGLLTGYLDAKSRIVKTFSMQALADLAVQDAALTARVIPILEAQVRVGSPAMQSRGRKLLKKLRKRNG
jgi:hypothetical protein